MTHHTDAERAEFEAWARGYGTWEVKRDDDVALGTTGYTDITLTVAWHAVQAARRAPAAPVPQVDAIGAALELESRAKLVESQTTERAMLHAANCLRMLAAAPQPPEAAPTNVWQPVPQWGKAGTCEWYDGYADHADGGGPYKERVLYTAPQAPTTVRHPLTDSEIESATGAKQGTPLFLAAKGFAIAIERAHGIGKDKQG